GYEPNTNTIPENPWIADAERYHADDEKEARRITARNELESYAYKLHNTLQDKEISIKIDPDDKKKLEDAIRNSIRWFDNNQEAERYQYEDRKQILEEITNPIMMKLYSQRIN
ncbi:7400_t:CDS:2, partial [Entrophospora sp. SA101]